jgi:hypothetical protein
MGTDNGPMKKKVEEFGQSPGAYSPPTYRGALATLVVIIGIIVLLWYAYGTTLR